MSTDRDDESSARHRHDSDAHDEWDELAVGFALTALEPDELQRFIEHLVLKCPQCRQSVADTSAIGAGLAMAMAGPLPEPGDALRESVLAAALQARPAVPQDARTLASVSSAVPVAAPPVDELAVRRQRKLSARGGWLVAAAAAVVALVLSITTVSAVHSRNQQAALADNYDRALAAISKGGSAVTVPLTDNSGHNVATVVARAGNVTVVTRGLKTNSAATSYVLWGMVKRNSNPVALGDFDVSSGKVNSVQVAADARGGYVAMQAFGLSLESGHAPPSKPTAILALGQR